MPIIWICLGFATGILSADNLDWGTTPWLILLLVVCVGGGTALKFLLSKQVVARTLGWLTLSALISFCLGALRYQLSIPDLTDPYSITNYLDGFPAARITGLVVGFPDRRDQTQNLRISVQTIDPEGQREPRPVQGLILARVRTEIPVSYGDQVRLTGSLGEAPAGEDFDYRAYLARQGIFGYLTNVDLEVLDRGLGNPLLQGIYSIKETSLENLYQLWPDPEASLLAGILLGVETGISEPVQKAFRETGTTHIIAISGFNITIVAGLFASLFSRFLNRYQAAAAAILGIVLYTLLVGADPAVVRAAVMGGLGIFARQIGRRQHGLNAAALASLLMIIVNPNLLWDISFQLSLAATLGLILYADPLASWFLELSSRFVALPLAERIARPVSEYFLFTLAAQLTTLPVMLYHFRSFSISTFLANPAILPVQPPIMILGGLALILSLVWFPLGQLTAPLVYPFVLYTIRVVEWFSRLPLQSMQVGEISLVWIGAFYAGLVILTFGKGLLIPLTSVLRPSLAAACLALGVLLTWRGIFSAPDGRLHLMLLDVGTGSAVFVESPGGQRLLINGGPSTTTLSDQLGRRLPPFDRNLDLALVASPREEDLDALAGVLPRFRPQRVVWLGDSSLCWEAENLRGILDEREIEIVYGQAGQQLVFQDGLRVEILSVNRQGGTLLIQYGSFRGLFPFGLTDDDRKAWREGKALGDMSVYYLADNGYLSSNPSPWIMNLNPQVLLLSVGLEDGGGLPSPGTLDRLGGYSLLRTDQHGTIHLITDGVKLWIRVDSPDGL
jgi:competence protein ComEC